MNGLKEEIKNWVRLLGLDSRLSAINIAQNVEGALGKKGGFRSCSRWEGDKGEIGHVHVNFQFKQVGLGNQFTVQSPTTNIAQTSQATQLKQPTQGVQSKQANHQWQDNFQAIQQT